MIPVSMLLVAATSAAQYLTPDERLNLTPYERESLKIQGQMQRDQEHRDLMDDLRRMKMERDERRREWMDIGKDRHDSYGYDSQNEYNGFDD